MILCIFRYADVIYEYSSSNRIELLINQNMSMYIHSIYIYTSQHKYIYKLKITVQLNDYIKNIFI